MLKLDEEQQFVVDSKDNLICIAGPGAGKTRVLTEKARKLFNENKSILCLCFTRAAAHEIQERVPGLPATTIHSYCCGTVGWNETWGYQGLLWRFLHLKSKPAFEVVLVDEVQDLNEMELDVAISLVGDKMFAVGDPYQSIYGFQGAMGPKIVPWFKALGCKEFALHNNYRSCPEIVERLNKQYPRKLVSKGIKDVGLDAILVRTNDDLFFLSSEMKREGIPHKVRLSTVFTDKREYNVLGESTLQLSTIHSMKGREADRVYLFGWLPNELGEEERTYYVAQSRASREYKEVSSLEELLVEVRKVSPESQARCLPT